MQTHGVTQELLINYTFTMLYKLREASLTYNFGAKTLERLPFTTASFQSLEETYGLSIKTLRMQILKLV
jgi:hypothetical protein